MGMITSFVRFFGVELGKVVYHLLGTPSIIVILFNRNPRRVLSFLDRLHHPLEQAVPLPFPPLHHLMLKTDLLARQGKEPPITVMPEKIKGLKC